MDCVRVRCAQIFYDYRAHLITKEVMDRKIEEIAKEIESKQLILTLNKKEKKS